MSSRYTPLVHFFYFVARPIFPQKICRQSTFAQKIAHIDKKCLQNACLSSFIVLYA